MYSRLALSSSRASSRRVSTSRTVRRDPWPVPNSPEHIASTTSAEDIPPEPLPRPDESLETARSRLVYQSRKRGTLESDLILSTFARDFLHGMGEEELKEYDRLLDEQDWDIYYWATGKRSPPERWANSAVLQKLAQHAKNEGKEVRKMPALSDAVKPD